MPDIFDASTTQLKHSEVTEKVVPSTPAETQTPPATQENGVNRRVHRKVDEYSEVMRHEQPTKNPFKAYVPKPVAMSFGSQGHDEHIVLLLRQHPITQVKWILIALFMATLPLLFSSIGFLGFLPATYKFAISIGWYLLLLGFIFESFLKWFFNIYILTDERVIDIDFISLIYKNESSAKIDNIQDVTATTAGFLGSVFDFGTVLIQTAAENVQFEFDDVPHPNKVVKLINELILEEEREKLEGRVN